MSKTSSDPKSLSDAIERLEKATHSKSQEIKDILGKDYTDLRQALDDLKPLLGEFSGKVSERVQSAKKDVEAKVIESPWTTLAVAGIVGLILGWVFGISTRRGE